MFFLKNVLIQCHVCGAKTILITSIHPHTQISGQFNWAQHFVEWLWLTAVRFSLKELLDTLEIEFRHSETKKLRLIFTECWLCTYKFKKGVLPLNFRFSLFYRCVFFIITAPHAFQLWNAISQDRLFSKVSEDFWASKTWPMCRPYVINTRDLGKRSGN